MAKRLEQVISALDRLHAEDPRSVDKDGKAIAAELLYAQRMSAWLATLAENPSECLQIAVRAQHLQRWQVPREDYPEGRVGYLTWRRDQGIRAGDTAAKLMNDVGYSSDDTQRVATLVNKKGLGRDADVQALEDCACLVFLENYFADFSRKVEHDHMLRIIQKTWRKMSPQAHEQALALPMSPASAALVKEALS
ncbi:uncharacterized protein DUF4202 [Vreelandella songnenensis]|uniref:Uncharacterized protein DUF4202 n=1 Tax=Vreelandella songnenensis TaxID=1176243 RepID=A0A2T0UR63_9GAMM|nr:DUF4202 domain-containing protein [Halomonas songnenensis]PRY60396.1 uncharacterized protein DUF4202 [Halomonas songnenensis]